MPIDEISVQALLTELDAKHHNLAIALGGTKETIYSRAANTIRELLEAARTAPE